MPPEDVQKLFGTETPAAWPGVKLRWFRCAVPSLQNCSVLWSSRQRKRFRNRFLVFFRSVICNIRLTQRIRKNWSFSMFQYRVEFFLYAVPILDPVLRKSAEKQFGERYLIFGNCNCSKLLLRRVRKTNSFLRTRKSAVIHKHRTCFRQIRAWSYYDANISTLLWHKVFNFVLDSARNTDRTTLLINRQGCCAAQSEGICRTKLTSSCNAG